MKVHIDGKLYFIEFAYAREQDNLNREHELTGCMIRDGAGYPRKKGEEYPILHRSWVSRYHKDVPNRDTARKAALAKVLQPYPKPVRRAFWQAYLNRRQKPVTAEGVGE